MTLDELEAAWNSEADQYNQWDELGLDEIVHFAQQQEREACAKVCDRWDITPGIRLAELIRART